MDDEELDPVEPNYAEKRVKYNVKKTIVARNRSIAVSFLKRVDKIRYGGLWIDFDNIYTRGYDQCPKDPTAA